MGDRMLKFLTVCAAIEDSAGAIYRQLAGMLPEDHELRGIWLEMAEDEAEHARQIRLAARLPAREVFSGMKLSLGRAEELLQRVREMQKELQGGRLAMARALKLSLQLEEEFRQVHVAVAMEFSDESMRRMFQSLSWNDDRHANLLRNYLAKVSDDSAAQGENA
jgi:rubrerythrin